MSKREKIILIVMALTVLYGFYALFLENPSAGPMPSAGSGNRLDAFDTFIANVAALVKEGASDEQAYILEHIPVKWSQDPLLDAQTPVGFKPAKEKRDAAQPAVTARDLGIAYTGFLNMGDRHLAIINGTEYESGEKLPVGGHIVEQIHPNRVVIGVQGSQKKITVKLEETP